MSSPENMEEYVPENMEEYVPENMEEYVPENCARYASVAVNNLRSIFLIVALTNHMIALTNYVR